MIPHRAGRFAYPIMSFLERRLAPIGNTFLNFPSPETARSHAGLGYAPSCLRRHHSLGSFLPLDIERGVGSLLLLKSTETSTSASASALQGIASVACGSENCSEIDEAHTITVQSGSSSSNSSEKDITTLVIRNLPTQLRQRELLLELDRAGFEGKYNFVYLPRCFNTQSNKGYAFVNMVNSRSAAKLRDAWHRYTWGQKPLDISSADVQGLHENMSRIVHKRFSRIRNPELRPFFVASE